MIKDKNKRVPMPTLDPEERIGSFSEVALGYTYELAHEEAERCLNCKDVPCISGCPVGIRIPDFISHVKRGDLEGAYSVIRSASSLPAVCGRVCPQESQCEARCVRGIKGESVAIGRLERFVADGMAGRTAEESTASCRVEQRVAVVGSGPSGLAAAGELISLGYSVTVFEALHRAGGVLIYGIPEFRLPKSVVDREIESLAARGVKFETNTVIGRSFTVDELFDGGYDAVFIGSGAGLPSFMGIPGEGLSGVFSANEYLTRVNLMGAYREGADTPVMVCPRVAVVGGGNVAMDAARTARRLGSREVYIIYRRSLDELPARREEVEHAMEEGVIFKLLAAPTEILGEDGFVTGMRLIDMELGEPDERGRRRPVPVPDSEHILEVDGVIMAIGTSPNPLIKSTTEGLAVNSRGGIVTDELGATSREGVFAGGDAVTGAATVISAMGAGKAAASAIHRYLSEKRI